MLVIAIASAQCCVYYALDQVWSMGSTLCGKDTQYSEQQWLFYFSTLPIFHLPSSLNFCFFRVTRLTLAMDHTMQWVCHPACLTQAASGTHEQYSESNRLLIRLLSKTSLQQSYSKSQHFHRNHDRKWRVSHLRAPKI